MKSKQQIIFIVAAFIACSGWLHAQQPDPVRLLEHIRFSAVLSDVDLDGEIKKGRLKIPIKLFKEGENVQFLFLGGGLENKRFHVRFDDDPDLLEIINGKTTSFPSARLKENVAKTDFTYEDLALRFLYWNQAKVIGSEKVNGHNCWKLSVENPGKKGSYGTVHVWVHKKYNAMIRMIGFGFDGRPVRRFEITDVMKAGEHWTLKKMRIDTLSSESGRATGVSYLTFKKPQKIKRRRGPR